MRVCVHAYVCHIGEYLKQTHLHLSDIVPAGCSYFCRNANKVIRRHDAMTHVWSWPAESQKWACLATSTHARHVTCTMHVLTSVHAHTCSMHVPTSPVTCHMFFAHAYFTCHLSPVLCTCLLHLSHVLCTCLLQYTHAPVLCTCLLHLSPVTCFMHVLTSVHAHTCSMHAPTPPVTCHLFYAHAYFTCHLFYARAYFSVELHLAHIPMCEFGCACTCAYFLLCRCSSVEQ